MSQHARHEKLSPPDAARLAHDNRQRIALQLKDYYGSAVRLVLDDGMEVEGVLRSMTVNGAKDMERPTDAITVGLRNLPPIALSRILYVASAGPAANV